jgi:prolyl-tRNA synthetase
MKDMYTFDVSEEDAIATYHEVCAEYESIFSALNLPVSKGRVNMVDRVWEKICVLCYCSKG